MIFMDGVRLVEEAAKEIMGDGWNYYSDALRPEIVDGFVQSIKACTGSEGVDYLEIGSCQGLSMALIALLLRARGRLRSLVSVDPYFDGGYEEGERAPHRTRGHVRVNKSTKILALELYARLGLTVELVEMKSIDGLRALVQADRRFDLVYIDGSHEGLWPLTDLGLSLAMLRRDGIIILDDHLWPDVESVKLLCDHHAVRLQQTWKTVSYRFPR
jgi:hypothetical protein